MTKINVVLAEEIGTISPNLYGHFVEHLGGVVYDGIYVGEDSSVPHVHGFRKEILDKLRALHPSVIRWPGGCFAETYNWRDGIGPKAQRPTTVNWWYNNDGLMESNQVGTHEFVDFCRLVGAEPYFALNATTTTPLEGRNWVEYCNMERGKTTLAKEREANGSPEPFDVKYWGLGNENWGGGGAQTPEDYCAIYRKYGIIVNSVYPQGYYIACGPYSAIEDWTLKFFERYREMYTTGRIPPMSGYSLHYYVENTGALGEETNYTDEQWYETLRLAWGIEPFIMRQVEMIHSVMPEKDLDLIVDEWGLWQLYYGKNALPGRHLFAQESTMRDALVAAVTLNVFNNHCDHVKMANVAQLVNCIQSLFLARGDRCIETTTYHVFDMYQPHKNGKAVKTVVQSEEISYSFDGKEQKIPSVSCSASVTGRTLNLTLANIHIGEDQQVELDLLGGSCCGTPQATVLAGKSDKDGNSFENPCNVSPKSWEVSVENGRIKVTVPKAGVVLVRVPLK